MTPDERRAAIERGADVTDCEHAEIYWYDKDGLVLTPAEKDKYDHGRCVKCWTVIPAIVSLHAIYCGCERCLERRVRANG